VLDPSFGGGVFLEASAKQLAQLGGSPETIYGIELDANVHAQVSLELHSSIGLDPLGLLQADFFDIEPKQLPKVDVIIGNPPFIRYQGFTGQSRAKALYQAEKQGVQLNHLASSWAAFIIHSVAFLKKGGRLAMVAPAELGHAQYAKPVLEFLLKSFGNLSLVTFKKPLFPKLNQDTLLILAQEKGQCSSHLFLQDAESIDTLFQNNEVSKFLSKDILENHYGLNFYSLPQEARDLYQRLMSSNATKKLGDLTHIGIGYVTGSNTFFHLSKNDVKKWQLSKTLLTPAVYKSKAFSGLGFTKQDWNLAEKRGEAGFLLSIKDKSKISSSLENYLHFGESQNVHQAYKCRVRPSWYSVPHVYQADAFLSYMSGSRALLVANHAKSVAPNTLHVVRLKSTEITANNLSVLWQNALTMLSTEIEGHSLGGGMLKLEPNEARQVLVPWVKNISQTFRGKLDELLRKHKTQQAIRLANKKLLIKSLGLSLMK
jgi:adenine-specific DNA-methyltransferase